MNGLPSITEEVSPSVGEEEKERMV